MRIPIFQVDAFASKQFAGNPAAVCVVEGWPSDALLQSIAAENNLAETAFLKRERPGHYVLRWFTPTFEIPLCGHATLAASHVVFHHLDPDQESLSFTTLSGELKATRDGDLITLDFPAYESQLASCTQAMIAGLGGVPREVYRAGINYYALFDSEEEVVSLKPDFNAILALIRGSEIIGIVPTARGDTYDFVSRYFAPEEGTSIGEDPVTGSIHSALIPFWSRRLGKYKMRAYQASQRGGELHCEMTSRDGHPRVLIGGRVQPYLEGTLEIL